MRRVDLSRAEGIRARRWDAVVLGSALPGLVAAARLGQAGHRVLVVEEESAARLPAAVREPFWLGQSGPEGLLDGCLTSLGIGLRDRRRVEPQELAYQVALPGARIEVGGPGRTQEELVGWGLAKPEAAREWVSEIASAAQAVLAGLAQAPIVRRGGLRGLGRPRSGAVADAGAVGLVEKLEGAAARFKGFVDAQLDVLSNRAPADLPAEAKVRLVGSALLGGGSFRSAEVTLRRLLRRRIEDLHGEVRTTRSFELVCVDPHPGIALPLSRELWLGRVLVLNAPPSLLVAAQRAAGHPVPEFLEAGTLPRRRFSLDLRCDPQVVPEAMCRRVIHALPPNPDGGGGVVSIERWPGVAAHEAVQIVARTVVDPELGVEAARDLAKHAVVSLMPFSQGRILEREHPWPSWDDAEAVEPSPHRDGWPPEAELRAATRRPVFVLDRSTTAALGTEGDILLGWRGGDALAHELG